MGYQCRPAAEQEMKNGRVDSLRPFAPHMFTITISCVVDTFIGVRLAEIPFYSLCGK